MSGPTPALKSSCLLLCSWLVLLVVSQTTASASGNINSPAQVCKRELDNANRTLANWADTMESMVNESKLSANVRHSIHSEANKILDLIEDFGQQIHSLPASQLARDLVTIRRRANRLALDVYLNTFDMRWPQNSLQLGVIVERVEQACLDRAAIQALESPPSNPLADLLIPSPRKTEKKTSEN